MGTPRYHELPHISQKECIMAPVVKTGSGRMHGVHEEGELAFRAIPDAQPPIGPLRFRPTSVSRHAQE
jgi:carboxylesterase type B